jgi:uncharacterized protein YbjT (DUF2867 family)
MIVVAGGTGTLGTRLVPRLAEQGLGVRVLTRDPARAQHLAGHAVEVARGDIRDPGSLASALRGAGGRSTLKWPRCSPLIWPHRGVARGR